MTKRPKGHKILQFGTISPPTTRSQQVVTVNMPGKQTTHKQQPKAQAMEVDKTTLEAVQQELLKQKEETKTLKREINSLKCESFKNNQLLSAKIARLEENVSSLDKQSRRYTFMVYGIPETENSPKYDIQKLFERMGHKDKIQYIDFVMRLGTKRQGSCRPISVELTKRSIKGQLYRAVKNVRKEGGPYPNLGMSDDVHATTQYTRLLLKHIALFARQSGHDPEATAKGDSLIIANCEADSFDTLHLLPEGITLQDYSLRTTADNGLAFSGEYAWPSNFYNTIVTVWGHDYANAEQAIQHRCALEDGQLHTADLILAEPSAYIIKTKLCRRWKKSDQCKEKEENFIKTVEKAKYKNEELRNNLTATKDRPLYEATRDLRWGSGRDISQAHLLNPATLAKAKAENKFGKLLEELREDILLNGWEAATTLTPEESTFPNGPTLLDVDEDEDIPALD